MKDRLSALKGPGDDNDEDKDEEMNDENKTKKDSKDSEYMKEFFVEVDAIKQSIAQIEQKVGELSAAHQRLLAGGECADKDKNEVETTNAQIRSESNKVRFKLKSMESDIEKLQAQSPGQLTVELRIRKTQQSTFSRKFIDAMTQYNKVQNEYRDACKERIKKQLEVVGKPHDDNELEELIRSDNPDLFRQELVLDDKEARRALTEVELRHKEILKLERCLQELHELFLDMARLVEQQGETIDRIENNVEMSTQVVAKAKEETKKAVKYQKAARKKKIIIACIVTAVVVVVVLIIVLNVT